jgi:1,4-alpha-glucan branching enzyme
MLYLDYSRRPGEWLRNRYGGRENLEAIEFLRETNELVRTLHPGCCTIAEESTAWPGVTKSAGEGGLGFTFKWNMGWMHDSLAYFSTDPLFRRYHHDQLTFAMMYEYTERFVMPLSHDEVVHLKRSLLNKMPGDEWQQRANLRTLLTYQYTRPGKKLLFMGTELATPNEWNHDESLPWALGEEPARAAFRHFIAQLGALYRRHSPLWRHDHEPEGFSWIDIGDREQSVFSYLRRDGSDLVAVILNLTPVPRRDYRVGAPRGGRWELLLDSDARDFGGSGVSGLHGHVEAEEVPFHGFPHSFRLTLPPLGALVLRAAPHGP